VICLRKIYVIAVSFLCGLVVPLVCSKIATNYFAVHSNIDPFSKNARLLTLLFFAFYALGAFCIFGVILLERFFRKNREE
jgi:hypothetical protein